VKPGDTFIVNINIGQVTNLNSYQFDLTYNNSVIQVIGDEGGEGVTDGKIGTRVFPVLVWGFVPAGTPGHVRVLGHIPGISVATGQGYLAQIRFKVVGTAGQNSTLILSGVKLIDPEIREIVFATQNGAITVSAS
jgi:hypothetical protein